MVPGVAFKQKRLDEGMTVYLFYEKRSKEAPDYYMQKERYVKLGYNHGKLVSIAAYFPNCPSYMKGPVYVLPK